MPTQEDERLHEPGPVAAPTQDDASRAEEEKTKRVKTEIDKAQSDVNTAVMVDSNDPKVRELEGELRGADPKNIDEQKLDRIAREAREKAAQKTQQAVMGGIMVLAGLAGITSMLKNNGVETDGQDHHPVLLGTDLPYNNAHLPTRENQEPGLLISQ